LSGGCVDGSHSGNSLIHSVRQDHSALLDKDAGLVTMSGYQRAVCGHRQTSRSMPTLKSWCLAIEIATKLEAIKALSMDMAGGWWQRTEGSSGTILHGVIGFGLCKQPERSAPTQLLHSDRLDCVIHCPLTYLPRNREESPLHLPKRHILC
jgi:hypothetical protein